MKLPASFKLAGLGTYCSPYYIDTNDLILQAVPQTDVPSSFINEAWILFIVELNIILRSVQADALNIGILQLMKFVYSQKSTAHLGGLNINICTFSNVYIDPMNNNYYNDKNNNNNHQFNYRDSKSDDDNNQHQQQNYLKSNEDQQKAKLKHETFTTTNRNSFSSGNIFIDFIDFMNDTIFRQKGGGGRGGGSGKGDDVNHMNGGGSNVDNIDNSTVDDNVDIVENIIHHHHKENIHDDIKSYNDSSNRSSNRSSNSRSSYIQESNNNRKQNIFSSIQSSVSSFLSSLFYSKFDNNDLCGKKLTFDQMCSATRNGQLRLGEKLMNECVCMYKMMMYAVDEHGC